MGREVGWGPGRAVTDWCAATGLVGLTSFQVTIDHDGRLFIGVSGRDQVLEPADDPVVCPACIWRTLLRLATRYTTTGRLAELLGPAEASPSTHTCQ